MMRRAGADYVHLFKTKFHLLPIKSPVEFDEALRVKAFLESRTAPLSEAAQDYKGVLEMLLLDYEVSLLDAEESADAPRIYADAATLEDDDLDPGATARYVVKKAIGGDFEAVQLCVNATNGKTPTEVNKAYDDVNAAGDDEEPMEPALAVQEPTRRGRKKK